MNTVFSFIVYTVFSFIVYTVFSFIVYTVFSFIVNTVFSFIVYWFTWGKRKLLLTGWNTVFKKNSSLYSYF